MKYLWVVLISIATTLTHAQQKFAHEKEIDHKERYRFMDIDFYNTDESILLSGTLITPKTDFQKVVVIIPGSGKDTRYAHHKLAEEFLQHNIAVYRFDERGVGKSEGKYTTTIYKLANDLTSCINHLRSIQQLNRKQIGVLGHSLGAMASAMISKGVHRKQIDFLVQVSSPVQNFASATKHQIQNLPHHKIKNKTNNEVVALLDTLINITKKNTHLYNNTVALRKKGIHAIKRNGFQLNDIKFWSNTHINLYKQDYEQIYRSIQIPTMYIIGSKDQFVDPVNEIKLLQRYNNPLVTVKVMKNLNHYLTSGVLKAHTLYNIHKSASEEIVNWVSKI